jgi:GNAT superfamily N-acetyltransferase
MSASFTVRRAKQSDHDALGALWMAFMSEQAGLDDRLAVADDARERWDNDFSVWLNDERQATFVAEVDDALRGFATAHQWGPPPIYEDAVEVYLDELYVAPEARRSGLGEKLVAAVRTWGATLGAARIRLQALHANEAAQAFWAACGAEPFAVTHTVELDPSEESSTDASPTETSSTGAPSRSIGFT